MLCYNVTQEVNTLKHVSVRIDEKTYKRLEEKARTLKLSKSWIIRQAIERFLDQLSRLDRVEMAFVLAEEVEPTEEEKRLIEEFRKKSHEFISQEELERKLGL